MDSIPLWGLASVWEKKRDCLRDLFLVLAGATGIAPCASQFGGTDFQPTQ